MKNKFGLGLLLFLLGLCGVLSMLSMELPIPEESMELLRAQFSEDQIKLLILVNPTIILLISVLVGSFTYQKVGLEVPILEKVIGLKDRVELVPILKYGLLGGILSGVLLSLVGLVYTPLLPEEFKELSESIQPSIAARFLYGGITEEILMRFGIMSLVVWVASKALGRKALSYWIGIVLSTLLFAFGHFPVAYQALAEPSLGLLSYLLLGNSIGGIIFGWLYWRKGLESAMIAHIFSHVVMVLVEKLM